MIQELKRKLMEICDVLYLWKTDYGMMEMEEILPTLSKIFGCIDDIEVQSYLIATILSPMLEAMEARESVDLADVINYELVPFLEECDG
ncbi:MAG: hypothetical protein PUA62_04125 [Lachnospiraceae bacterium]|nr:hypothetical protein [Lachnospiraceae bacterium]